MKNLFKKQLLPLVLALELITLSLSGCGFAVGQLKGKANEEKLLKPDALDHQLTDVYDTYTFKFLDKYQVTHQFLRNSSGCRYAQRPTLGVNSGAMGEVYAVTDIFEKDSHTWQLSSKPGKPFNFDRYTRAEWTVSGYQGKPVTNKGFAPICGQVWAKTNHSLSVSLVKLPLDAALKRYTVADVPISKQLIGKNIWTMQTSELEPPEANSYGADYLAALLPIEDTGYTFVFKLKANEDSLNYPQVHAQMQQIFKHLIESVRIESLSK